MESIIEIKLFVNAFLQTLIYVFPFGMQNLYVLRQGVLGRHSLAAALSAIFSDVCLICFGAFGLGVYFDLLKQTQEYITKAGGIFLFFYGSRCLLKALLGTSKFAKISHVDNPSKLWQVVLYTACFSFLNPQVIVETTIFLGNQAHQLTLWPLRAIFLSGSFFALITWFFGLSFGAKTLHFLFEKPLFVRLFDAFVGIVLYYISIQLLLGKTPAFI